MSVDPNVNKLARTEIDEHEKELQALLLRVMAAPLTPVLEKLGTHDSLLEDIEKVCCELRDLQAGQTDDIGNLLRRELKVLGTQLPSLDQRVAALESTMRAARRQQDEVVDRLLAELARTQLLFAESSARHADDCAAGQEALRTDLLQAAHRLRHRITLIVVFVAMAALAAAAALMQRL